MVICGVIVILTIGLKFPFWLIAVVSGCMSIIKLVTVPAPMVNLAMISMWSGGTESVS